MNTCTSVFGENGDYWKLLKNGTLVNDGKKDLDLTDFGKGVLKADPNKTNSQNIADMLGITPAEASKMLGSAWNGSSYTSGAAIALSPDKKALFDKLVGVQSAPAEKSMDEIYAQKVANYRAMGESNAKTMNAIGSAIASFFGFKPQTQAQQNAASATVYGPGNMLSQQSFEEMYGMNPRQNACVTTDWTMTVAMMTGGLPKTALDAVVPEAMRQGWMNSDGSLEKIPLYTKALFAAVGQSAQLDYVYDNTTGNRIGFDTLAAFQAAGYQYGLASFYNDTTRKYHTQQYSPAGFYDPLGNRSYDGSYTFKQIYPIQKYKVGQ